MKVDRGRLLATWYIPSAFGLAEVIADYAAKSAPGLGNRVEDCCEGFFSAHAGRLMAIGFYKILVKTHLLKSENRNTLENVEIMGSVVGLLSMILISIPAHKLLGTNDINWIP